MSVESSLEIHCAADIFSLFLFCLDCGVVYYFLLVALPLQWAIFSSASLAIAGFLLWVILFLSRQQLHIVGLDSAFYVSCAAI